MHYYFTMLETNNEEIFKNGHSEEFIGEEEEGEDEDEHDIQSEINGWSGQQQKMDGNRIILVGRIDPMEHVEPVYGTDEEDENDDDDLSTDRDGCGSDCSHGRSEEIAAENNSNILDAWLSALIGPEKIPAESLQPQAGVPNHWNGHTVPLSSAGLMTPAQTVDSTLWLSWPHPSVQKFPQHTTEASHQAPPDNAPTYFSLENLLQGGGGAEGEDQPYSCPICQQRFSRYSHYAKHLYFAHENGKKHMRLPGSRVHPQTLLYPSDPPLPTNNGVSGSVVKESSKTTYIYGDTLIFPGGSQIISTPPSRGISQLSGTLLPLSSRQKSVRIESSSVSSSGQKSYACPVCDMTFPDRESRTRHAQEHEQFLCGICGRSFRDKAERDHHTSMYAGKPVHKCDACGKCFHLAHSFARHVRTHTGEQPFSCDVCGKRFNDSGNMSKHLRTHMGGLPFPCPQCPKRFSDREARANHARSHHGDDRPFPCTECGRTFANGSNLARHLKATHGQKFCRMPLSSVIPSQRLILPKPQIPISGGLVIRTPGPGIELSQGGGVVC